VEKVRVLDVFESFRVRWHGTGRRVFSGARLFKASIVQLFNEFWWLVGRFELTLESRGSWPAVRGWVVPPNRRQSPVIGDVAILTLAVLPAVAVGPGWIPSQFKDLVQQLPL